MTTQTEPTPISETAAVARALEAISEGQRLQLLENRRRRWRTFWWRLAGFVLLAVVLLGAAVGDQAQYAQPHIARVTIDGVIADDPARDALLQRLAEDDNVQAVIVRINSGGGTVVGGEALFHGLRAVAESKPVVAVFGEAAASAAYMTAIAADYIVSRENTATGSIGAIFTVPNFSEALTTLGVEIVELRSGARKAQPSPWGAVDLDALQHEQRLVEETGAWFLELVRERRELDAAAVAELRDGRVVTGGRALELGLVDEIGGETEALAWLVDQGGVAAATVVLDRAPAEPEPSIADVLFGGSPFDVASGAFADVLEAAARTVSGPRLLSEMR